MKDSFLNHVDRIFRDALLFHKKEPGKHVWDQIEKELDSEEKSAVINKTRPGSKKIAALLLLAFFLSSMFVYDTLNSVQRDKSVLPAGNKNSVTRNAGNEQQKRVDRESLSIARGNRMHRPSASTIGNGVNPRSESTTGTDMNPPSKSTIGNGVNPHSASTTGNDMNRPSASTIGNGVNPHSASTNGITTGDPDPVFSMMPVSPMLTRTDDATVNPDHFFLPVPTSVIHDSPFQLSAGQPVIRLAEPKLMDRFSITAYFSQEFAGYNFADNDITEPNGKEIEKAERNIFSASLGVYLNYKINKRWMVQTGISYSWSRSIMDSSQSYAVKNDAGDVAFKLNTASGFGFLRSPSFIVPMIGDSMGTAKTHSELHYLTVPLIVSYRIPKHRFTIMAGAGMTFNFLTQATLETDIYGSNYRQSESEIPIKGLKKINTGLLVKAEVQYQLSSKISVSVMPSFKNTLGPIHMNSSSLSAYPYNFGIGAGIVYSF